MGHDALTMSGRVYGFDELPHDFQCCAVAHGHSWFKESGRVVGCAMAMGSLSYPRLCTLTKANQIDEYYEIGDPGVNYINSLLEDPSNDFDYESFVENDERCIGFCQSNLILGCENIKTREKFWHDDKGVRWKQKVKCGETYPGWYAERDACEDTLFRYSSLVDDMNTIDFLHHMTKRQSKQLIIAAAVDNCGQHLPRYSFQQLISGAVNCQDGNYVSASECFKNQHFNPRKGNGIIIKDRDDNKQKWSTWRTSSTTPRFQVNSDVSVGGDDPFDRHRVRFNPETDWDKVSGEKGKPFDEDLWEDKLLQLMDELEETSKGTVQATAEHVYNECKKLKDFGAKGGVKAQTIVHLSGLRGMSDAAYADWGVNHDTGGTREFADEFCPEGKDATPENRRDYFNLHINSSIDKCICGRKVEGRWCEGIRCKKEKRKKDIIYVHNNGHIQNVYSVKNIKGRHYRRIWIEGEWRRMDELMVSHYDIYLAEGSCSEYTRSRRVWDGSSKNPSAWVMRSCFRGGKVMFPLSDRKVKLRKKAPAGGWKCAKEELVGGETIAPKKKKKNDGEEEEA